MPPFKWDEGSLCLCSKSGNPKLHAASENAAIVLDPSTAYLTDALHIKASAAQAHVFVASGEASGREEVKGSKSSWFQRLKPRNDMELSRGAVTETVHETPKTEKGCASSKRLEVGVRILQPDCVSQILGSRPHPNWQAETTSVAKRQKTIEAKNYGETERQRSNFAQEKVMQHDVGRIDAIPAAPLPTNVGFGPWVNLRFGKKSDTERIAIIPKSVVDTATTSGQEVRKEVQGNSHSALNVLPKCSLGVMQGEATIPTSLCKPHLSPKHIKLGLPPRPPNQKIPGFHSPSKVASLASGLGRGVFHQLAIANQPNGQILATQAIQVLDMQDRESEHGEATLARPSLQKMKAVEGSFFDTAWHSKGLPDTREQFSPLSLTGMGNGGMLSKLQPRPFVIERRDAGVALEQHTESSSAVAMGRPLEDGARESVCANVLSNISAMDLHPEFVDTGTEISKASSKNGSMLQAASLEPTKSTLQQSLTASSSRGTTRVAEQVTNGSSSATLPWELFIEPAGASMKAREQFVEVYNRARDELKNQRLLQNVSRAPGRELDGGPKLTSGSSGAISDTRVERQSMELGQRSSGQAFQGRNSKLEHQISPHPSSLKETITAESTQSKQTEGFRQVQPLRAGQLRLSQKIVMQEAEIPMQGTVEGSVVHGKGLRSGDMESQILSNNAVCNQKELISKLDNDIKCTGLGRGSREPKQNNGPEAVPILGKRPRVNFEDQPLSFVAEKGAGSKVRPQSKPLLWLQRWHSTSKHSPNDSPDNAQVASDVKKSDPHNHQTLGLKKFKDGDAIGVVGRANVSADRVKTFKASSSKVLPSAAAMAIVGTAARQFCSLQPEGKGSFAFWSGFGIPTNRKAEGAQENGKDKVFVKANMNLPSC